MSNHPNKAEMQICVSLYLPWSSLRSCLLNSINRSWFQRVWSQQRDEKKNTCFVLVSSFRQISKTADRNAQLRNCMCALRSANLLKNERRFRVAATAYVRKSATQENWADLRRRVCVGLCDRWSYSGAVLRAEWISQIILWVMRSGLVAHKSTGGLKPRSPKGKTASSCFFFFFCNHCFGLHMIFLIKKLWHDNFRGVSHLCEWKREQNNVDG